MDVEAMKSQVLQEHLEKARKKGNKKKEIKYFFIDCCRKSGYDMYLTPTAADIAKALAIEKNLRSSGWTGSILDLIELVVKHWGSFTFVQKKNLTAPDLGCLPVLFKEALQRTLAQGEDEIEVVRGKILE